MREKLIKKLEYPEIDAALTISNFTLTSNQYNFDIIKFNDSSYAEFSCSLQSKDR